MTQGSQQHSATPSRNAGVVAVHVPMTFRKRGGKKVIVTPNGTTDEPQAYSPPHSSVESDLVATLAQAHRWQRMLDDGRFATIADLAHAEKLDRSLVSRTLRLTLLAPDIVEAILDGRQSATIQRPALLRGFPWGWPEQHKLASIQIY